MIDVRTNKDIKELPVLQDPETFIYIIAFLDFYVWKSIKGIWRKWRQKRRIDRWL